MTDFTILTEARDDRDRTGAIEKTVCLPMIGSVQNERIPGSANERVEAPCVSHVEAKFDVTVDGEQIG